MESEMAKENGAPTEKTIEKESQQFKHNEPIKATDPGKIHELVKNTEPVKVNGA
jgi:hypothetical protein